MADIKTHLRELSVAVGIYYTHNQISLNGITTLSPNAFLNVLRGIINNNINAANNIASLTHFTDEHISIINNGLSLGKKIVEINLCYNYNIIKWVGGDAHKNDPIDLIVGTTGFSLKEESFILENMGLYKLINLLTGSNLQRGLHVFENYAQTEYHNWFNYTWNALITSNLPWRKNNGRYISEIKIVGNDILFMLNNHVLSTLPNQLININQFHNLTTSKSREKIFSKWINDRLKTDQRYLHKKNLCSYTAGENLCSSININLNPTNLHRLLQIYNDSYYYAKTTSNNICIFYVPSLLEYQNTISVSNINFSVPASQLNIHITISNNQTGYSIVFRNECRFSHGQFNGTPEAKMYYERGNDLSVIYNRIL